MVNDGSSWLMMVDNDTYIYIYIHIQLVGGWATSLKNMRSAAGMMKFSNKKHQSVTYCLRISSMFDNVCGLICLESAACILPNLSWGFSKPPRHPSPCPKITRYNIAQKLSVTTREVNEVSDNFMFNPTKKYILKWGSMSIGKDRFTQFFLHVWQQ